MTPSDAAFRALDRYCEGFARSLEGITEGSACIEGVRERVSRLLGEGELFAELLREISEGGARIDVRRPTMFDNEILVHADPERRFSLRLYLYGPGQYTAVHDHNSWGVIGPASGELEVFNYRREDDGSREGYAELREAGRLKLAPGQTASTLALNRGIHRVGNPTEQTVASVNLYGTPIPRGFVLGFDVERRKSFRIMSPAGRKRALAAEALQALRSAGQRG